MRFAGLLACFAAAYGGMSAVGVALGFVALVDGITNTVSVAGAFAVGWVLRDRE